MPPSGIQIGKARLDLLAHENLLHHIVPRSRSRELIDQKASLGFGANGFGLHFQGAILSMPMKFSRMGSVIDFTSRRLRLP